MTEKKMYNAKLNTMCADGNYVTRHLLNGVEMAVQAAAKITAVSLAMGSECGKEWEVYNDRLTRIKELAWNMFFNGNWSVADGTIPYSPDVMEKVKDYINKIAPEALDDSYLMERV